jgi:hypothetical protein
MDGRLTPSANYIMQIQHEAGFEYNNLTEMSLMAQDILVLLENLASFLSLFCYGVVRVVFCLTVILYF